MGSLFQRLLLKARTFQLRQKHLGIPELILIRRIRNSWIEPGRFLQNGPVMAEGVETEFAMITAHAAIPHPSKGHVGIGHVHDGVVDTAAA